MAVGVDDWLVADSEGEDVFTQLPPVNGSGASAATRSAVAGNLASPDVSVIQTAKFSVDQLHTPQRGRRSPLTLADGSLFTPPSGGMNSTIDNFTNALSTSGAPSAAPPRPRPRPRVVMKKAAPPHHNADAASTSFSHISDPPISTAGKTNDSIHPATATSVGLSEVAADAYSSFGIAERAKMRSRKSQTAKKPIQPPYQMNEIIELTSDEDELALKPTKRQKKQGNSVPKPNVQTKPRPKPTLKVKPATALPSGSPSNRTMMGPQAPPAQRASPSQPPASTLPTIPPSTPPQARELTPLSSPPVFTQKRKRIRPSFPDDDDEMGIIGGSHNGVSPLFVQPPLFFAPSSSSVPTDSGIDIPPVEPLSVRGKKGKGKKVEISNAIDEVVEASARIAQEPPTPATEHTSTFTNECHSPVVGNSTVTKEAAGKQTATKKGQARVIHSSDDENESVLPSKSNTACTPLASEGDGQRNKSKKNLRADNPSPPKRDPPLEHTSTPGLQLRGPSIKPKLTPMSELIRRVNSQPSSPFPNASRTYTPLLKSSRTMLSRIAPLHPNRRTPPPPMPRPPPPKKSKKQLEMEEWIEEELSETVDGWSCLTDEERKALRKARIDAELGYE
ncbi:hypothetical protein J3R82DRAFT_11744 [Butyriboletus roseoflavus]|nr:hypothetical protein J3R82DRAFT_11744 [Butyriboletus roseoflavus]